MRILYTQVCDVYSVEVCRCVCTGMYVCTVQMCTDVCVYVCERDLLIIASRLFID